MEGGNTVSIEAVIGIATGIVTVLAGTVAFLYRAYSFAKDREVKAKDETIALAVGALNQSTIAHREAAGAMVRMAETQGQAAMATSQLVATMNAAQATSSKEHAAVIQELRAQRRERAAGRTPKQGGG